jgi:hypothetical protein
MHLPGSRWEEIALASVVHVLKLLAMHFPRSRWEELATHSPCTQVACNAFVMYYHPDQASSTTSSQALIAAL